MPGRGRPTTYKPEYSDRVIELGKQGMSECEMARELDVPRSTLRTWGNAHPDFAAAFERAKELAQSWWEQQARDNLGKREFNPQLWMKVVASRYRQDYSEKTILEHTGANGEPLKGEWTEAELDRRLQQLMAKQNAALSAQDDDSDSMDKASHAGSESVN